MGLVMTRVLILHPALAPYRIDLFNQLATQCELEVVFLRDAVKEQAFDRAKLEAQLHCRYRYLVNGWDWHNHLFRRGIGGILREFRPDIVVPCEFGVQTVQLLNWPGRRFKIVSSVDDSPAMAQADNWKNRYLKPFLLKRLAGVIVCSEAVRRIYAEQFSLPTAKIAVCPVLQDTNSLREKMLAGREAALTFLKQYQLAGRKTVLYVGRLTAVKNLPLLLRAFAAGADADARLLIIGDGEQRSELEALARQLAIADRVVMPGRYDGNELYAWYWLGKLFVLPSTFEPFGAVVNEALAAGMPCLVSAAAGAADLLASPAAGATFSPDDETTLTSQLRQRLATMPELDGTLSTLPPAVLSCDLSHYTAGLAAFFRTLTESDSCL